MRVFESVIVLLILLQFKHFIFDFLYQPPYMWKNKGKLGHPGGLLHAVLHSYATYAILLFYLKIPLIVATWIFYLEFVAHYIIDFAKMNINAKMGWKCNTHNEFWQLTGFDQLLHQLTYALIIYMVIN